jgi:hypothetical protein
MCNFSSSAAWSGYDDHSGRKPWPDSEPARAYPPGDLATGTLTPASEVEGLGRFREPTEDTAGEADARTCARQRLRSHRSRPAGMRWTPSVGELAQRSSRREESARLVSSQPQRGRTMGTQGKE